MRIAVVLPRGMDFSASRATSIDLCAHDFALHSRFRDGTLVIGAASGAPLDGVPFQRVPRARLDGRALKPSAIVKAVRDHAPDAIVVHQHVQTAASIARRFQSVPVVLHRHNYEKKRGWLQSHLKVREYARLASVILVSDFVRADYVRQFPDFGGRMHTVHNGLDPDAWRPATDRERTILFVGRAVPEKGTIEALRAIRAVLGRLPGWTGTFILSGLDEAPVYARQVVAEANSSDGLIEVRVNRPFSEVKAATESAAIALVPSLWNEPFGRTALEAHAGGAALISSGRGGLAEISRDAALFVAPEDGTAFANAILRLGTDPELRRRLARAGRDRAASLFDIRTKAAEIDDILTEVAAAR